ncbi:MAG: adenylosuccinate lyase [Methanoregulaceae archaeon PtaU1.Bin222]|nr:MAG: adenylosuccinate lyase [Methanoregulaceae archaeon PtaU1.Bin222]
MEEAFGSRQVGSSTMPHKRNPIKSEQVCGLARVVRSAVEPALQNNTLWDERDLTNSSCERVIFPEASILTDHILALMIRVIEGLTLKPERIARNLEILQGVNMAESVMIELTRKGMNRQEAHEVMRKASMDALSKGTPLSTILSKDEAVKRYISPGEIRLFLDPGHYIGTAPAQVDRVIAKLTPLCVKTG